MAANRTDMEIDVNLGYLRTSNPSYPNSVFGKPGRRSTIFGQIYSYRVPRNRKSSTTGTYFSYASSGNKMDSLNRDFVSLVATIFKTLQILVVKGRLVLVHGQIVGSRFLCVQNCRASNMIFQAIHLKFNWCMVKEK